MILLSVSVVLNIVLFVLLFAFASREGDETTQVQSDESNMATTETVASAPIDSATPTVPRPTQTLEVETSSDKVGSSPIAPTTEPEATPTSTPTPEPSSTPVPTLTPTLTPTPEPTATATPMGSPTPVVLQGPDWLIYLNTFRLQAGLPPVAENTDWSNGSRLHSIYMVNTGQITHNEDTSSPYFTRDGQTAAENGNLAAGHISVGEYDWAMNYWISAPFHGVPILDPQLEAVGFGTFRDANAAIHVAATLDVKQGLGSEVPSSISYPILYPKDGGEAWVLRYSLPEFPDARPHCGYGSVSGAPIVVQIGSGDQVPNVTNTDLRLGNQSIPHCVFDETTYTNASASRQQTGRNILDQRDAIVILPQNPLSVGETYTVEVVVNGETITWSFDTVSPPRVP